MARLLLLSMVQKQETFKGKTRVFLFRLWDAAISTAYPIQSTKLQEVARENGINEKMLVSQHSAEERKLNPRRKPLTRFYLIYVLIAITNSVIKLILSP